MTRSLRIALFTEIYDCGGIDTFIANLINHWPSAKDSFVIIANETYPGLQIIEARVARPITVIRHRIPIFDTTWTATGVGRAIKRALSPALRYAFGIHNVFAIRPLLRRADADVLMVVNGGYPGGDSCRAATIAWRTIGCKSKAIHNFHNIVQRAPWYVTLQERVVDAAVSGCTSEFVTVSKAAAESMAVRPVIATKGMTTFIHNGIEDAPNRERTYESVRAELGIAPETPLCALLATYEPRKGHHFLFQAFRKVLDEIPDAHLLVCGFGFPHEIAQVRGFVREFRLNNRVHLMGFRSDVSNVLSEVDVVVVASQANESFGFTSVEAMARRIPVVATDVGGIPEVVVTGEGGYCVGRDDVDTYAAILTKLLKDSELRGEQGRLGRVRFERLFRAETMAARYAQILTALAGR